MIDFSAERNKHLKEIEILVYEVTKLTDLFSSTAFFGTNHNFPNAHYGYIMTCMGKIDYLSQYWDPDNKSQTSRMRSFMERFLHSSKSEEIAVCVEMFRHELMHTGKLGYVYNQATDSRYTWHIRFDNQLEEAKHFTIETVDPTYQDHLMSFKVKSGSTQSTCKCIFLDIRLFSLDVFQIYDRYFEELINDTTLQSKFEQKSTSQRLPQFN